MVNQIILKSSRLMLRTPLEEDIQCIAELQKEITTLDWFQPKNDKEKFFLDLKNEKFNYYIFSIILRSSNSFIGCCGLKNIDIKLQANIFYALLSNFWGNGYGYESIKELINF